MKDPEFRKLMKTFFLGVFIALLFVVPMFFFIKNKIINDKHDIIYKLNKKETMVLCIVSNDCSNCNKIKKELNNSKVKYDLLNKNTNRDYKEIINKLGLDRSKINEPTLIYISKGKLKSYMVEINQIDELKEFIDNYKLSK